MTAGKLLGRLQGVRASGPARWMARCPAHEDRSPSLSIRETGDGTVLVNCFAGCTADAVVAAVGLQLRDLYPDRPGEHRHPPSALPRAAPDIHCCLATEGLILAVAASDIAEGRTLTRQDADRIASAAGRVRAAWVVFNGHR
jgi:hypothetical protein